MKKLIVLPFYVQVGNYTTPVVSLQLCICSFDALLGSRSLALFTL